MERLMKKKIKADSSKKLKSMITLKRRINKQFIKKAMKVKRSTTVTTMIILKRWLMDIVITALVGTTAVINRRQFSFSSSFSSRHLMDQSEQSRYIDALL